VKKVDVPTRISTRLVNFGSVMLVTSQFNEKTDLTPIAWNFALSHKLPIIGIAVAKKHYINELIDKSGEYVVNLPDKGLLEKVKYCGSVSGRDVDKFSGSGLNMSPSRKVSAPQVAECAAHVECKVINKHRQSRVFLIRSSSRIWTKSELLTI
jgi:flavin reductase (DIM6/NTAB) family NADH-FMN oxidoreductase RutF